MTTNDSNIRPGFNGQGQINLTTFQALNPINFNDAQFSHYEFADLKTIDVETEKFWNIGIREESEGRDRIESFQVSFRNKGLLLSEFPPCKDTDGEWIDGRGRIQAAKKNGERWMPTAVYIRSNSSLKNTVTNAMKANLHDPRYPATFTDFVAAGAHLVNNGELENAAPAIDNWLYHEVKIETVYDNSINGMVTKIRDAIIKRAKRDDSLILQKDKTACHKWIKTNLGLSKSEYILVNMGDNETYPERVWCRHVLPAIVEERDPVNIIYYTSSFSPSDTRKGLKKSMEYLEKLYQSSFELVNSQLSQSITINPPATRPYVFLGAIPQIVQTHNISGHNLVSVNKY